MTITQITTEQANDISQVAAREILPFKQSYDIYALHVQGVLVAVASLYYPSKRTVRFAGAFTLPEYRGLGYGLVLAEHRWALVQSDERYRQARIVDCYAKHPAWFIGKGFTMIRAYRSTTYVRYTVGAQGTR